MNQQDRLVDRSQPPTAEFVAAFIGPEGAERWSGLIECIDSAYPGIFNSEWLYVGAGHGWSLLVDGDSDEVLGDVELLLRAKRRPTATPKRTTSS